MSIQSGAQELCQKGLGFRGYRGEMDQEGRWGFGEVRHHKQILEDAKQAILKSKEDLARIQDLMGKVKISLESDSAFGSITPSRPS